MLCNKRIAITAAVLLQCSLNVAAWSHETASGDDAALRVMTQNLYIGADLTAIVATTDPQQIPLRVAETLATIEASDFAQRAERIAAEIKHAHADFVALQEVSLLRTQFPGDFLIGNPQAASEVRFDYLTTLLAALEKRGLHYRVAGSIQNADVEVPALAGVDSAGNPLFMDVRLTDRDVTLVRQDIGTWNVTTANYQVNLQLSVAGTPIEFTRGYVAVDTRVGGRRYRIVNTHLEQPTPAPIVPAMQAQELVARFSFAPFPVILLGDFNSMPEDTIDPNSGAVPPYTQLVGSGFVDLWLERIGRRDPRYTCCQAEDLRNRASMLDMRIDHIFVRNPDGDQTFARPWHIRSWTVGDKRNDKTVSGLWPSDHAGVIAVIQPRHDSARRGKRNLVASHHRFRCGNEPAERASCEHP